jgi:hypothetical protein
MAKLGARGAKGSFVAKSPFGQGTIRVPSWANKVGGTPVKIGDHVFLGSGVPQPVEAGYTAMPRLPTPPGIDPMSLEPYRAMPSTVTPKPPASTFSPAAPRQPLSAPVPTQAPLPATAAPAKGGIGSMFTMDNALKYGPVGLMALNAMMNQGGVPEKESSSGDYKETELDREQFFPDDSYTPGTDPEFQYFSNASYIPIG